MLCELLAPIRRAHESLLQVEIDSGGIARVAFSRFLEGLSKDGEREQWRNSNFVTSGLDGVVAQKGCSAQVVRIIRFLQGKMTFPDQESVIHSARRVRVCSASD